MDLLEPHIKSGLGVAFKADNGQYWSLMYDGDGPGGNQYIEAAKPLKDAYTKFFIEKENDNMIRLKSSENGRYLKLVIHDGIQSIYAEAYLKMTYDCDFLDFLVYDCGNGKIAIKCDANDMFLGRVIRDGNSYIDASKGGIDDVFSAFSVETGSITPVKEEILGITWGSLGDQSTKPKVVEKKQVENSGSETANSEVTLSWTFSESSETSWESSWGVTTEVSCEAGFEGAGSVGFKLDINFSGKTSGNTSSSRSQTFTETTSVKIPSKKKVVVELIVSMIENAEIPFTAKIRRTSEDGVKEFEERGTWKGVLNFSSDIKIHETDI